jgi:hypothetical protein
MEKLTIKFNVTRLHTFGNGGGGQVWLKPVLEDPENEKYIGGINIQMPSSDIELFEGRGEFNVTFERAE